MPLFLMTCLDKPDALEVRMGAREAHLAYVRERIGQVRFGGPLLTDDGAMMGSMLVLDMPDRAAAEAFNRDDPYTKAGLFQRVEIHSFRATVGQV